MTKNKIKIHIAGMGGQGIGITSRILTTAANLANLDVVSMETHGLAQRGGVVVSDIGIGLDPEESPLCGEDEADIVLSLELLEGLRSLPYLKDDGLIIVNKMQYHPLHTRLDPELYPYPTEVQILTEIKRRTSQILIIDANQEAASLGLSQIMNVILLGALSRNSEALPFTKFHLIQAIKSKVNPKYHEINIKAFEIGQKLAK